MFTTAMLFTAVLGATGPRNDVVSIAIETAWGGLGTPQTYRTTIRRDGNGFVRDDGTPVDATLVASFTESLSGPHPESVVAADVGLTTDLLKSQIGQAESCLGDTRSVNAVRSAFEQQYYDEPAIAQWLRKDYQTMHTDDYPSLSVDLKTTSETIVVKSDSQHLFMLPFTIDRGGRQTRVFDPRIPHALAALLPPKAANKSRLENQSLLSTWAYAICTSDAVREQQNKLGKDDVKHLAAR